MGVDAETLATSDAVTLSRYVCAVRSAVRLCVLKRKPSAPGTLSLFALFWIGPHGNLLRQPSQSYMLFGRSSEYPSNKFLADSERVCMASVLRILLIGMGLFSSGLALSQIVRITPAEFLPAAGIITFSEKPLGTVNPTYVAADYGGGAGAPTVTFKGFFQGQSLGLAAPPCPVGAALTGCVLGSPSNPLSLAAASPNTTIVTDVSTPSTPVLSGSPTFNGPIAVLFSTDLAAVGLAGGFFDAPASTSITAYRRDGSLLGSVTNLATGIEFLGLRTTSGANEIAGLLFSLAGNEPFGFDIDNLRFGTNAQIAAPVPDIKIPIPTLGEWGLGMMGALLAAAGALALRRRTARR